jgi:hypothetical protein
VSPASGPKTGSFFTRERKIPPALSFFGRGEGDFTGLAVGFGGAGLEDPCNVGHTSFVIVTFLEEKMQVFEEAVSMVQ